ncbi:(d)CMP kinase [Pararhodospirillum photometricum]|uniref:Cytidylate kinase n=1 Tax=Pararhodospirillum photometricum DSM 122 TaxID=1150469 RepID=H6SLF3_PARPM|nr:(d)CMP kinase [Pararhodospirillum photometricum]CCG08818.1 Cytidylate kinase [Pararhodospirillum photometricum DSM 122]
MIIAIDGPAAAGKGTLSRRLAADLGYAHLDTGKLYRAVGMAVLRAGGDPSDPRQAEAAARALDLTTLGDPVLTTDTAGQAASKVAALEGVRAALLDLQRRFAATPPGAVLDGRDIGTVVCPDADVKVFVTASLEVRAQRRFLELRQNGLDVKEDDVVRDMRERDERDRSRSVAPLVPADDAVVLDTSTLTADQALAAVHALLALKG